MATPKNRSVMKAFSLLQSFERPDEWLTSTELSRRAALPEASGYRLVHTLEGLGAIVRDSRGRYRPGMLLLQLSEDIVARELWREAPQDLLDRLAADLDVAVQVGVYEDGMVSYVAAGGKPRHDLAITTGTQFEAYCTGLGKVLLAALSDERLADFLEEGELVRLTEWTITDRTALHAELRQIRERGFAVDDRETLESLRCMAAPIRDRGGRVVAALSISDRAENLTEPRRQQVRERVLQAAAAVGERFFPWPAARPRAASCPAAAPAASW